MTLSRTRGLGQARIRLGDGGIDERRGGRGRRRARATRPRRARGTRSRRGGRPGTGTEGSAIGVRAEGVGVEDETDVEEVGGRGVVGGAEEALVEDARRRGEVLDDAVGGGVDVVVRLVGER